MKPHAIIALLILSLIGFPQAQEVVYPASLLERTDVEGMPAIAVTRGDQADGFPLRGSLWTQDDLDPGVPPEGDYMASAAFATDGQRVFLTNRLTENISVYDWPTRTLITTIDLGTQLGGIAINDDYAIVTAPFSDEVYILDVTDYSVEAVIPTGVQPWVVRISPDDTKAFIGCDIDDVCEVIDLTTLSHAMTIEGFPFSLTSFGFISENGRQYVRFSEFEVTPDGQHLIVGDRENSVLFYNTTTGSIDQTIPGLEKISFFGLSGDQSKAIAVEIGVDPGQAHQIDLSTKTVTASVNLPAQSYTEWVGVNQDGSKAFIGTTGNQSAIIRFDSGDSVVFPQTYSPFWIGTTVDHSHAISGQYRFSIIDFAAEEMVAQLEGIYQSFGYRSPVSDHLVSYDPLRSEVLRFYDVTTPASPLYLGGAPAGMEPEGDGPRRVAITPDGTKAVVVNVLSGNCSIIDLATKTVETILPIGERAQGVAITSDSRWAVVCGMETGAVSIVDLSVNAVVANVATGTRPGVVVISPDDAYAYVANVVPNTVSVVELNGPLSSEVAEFYVGVIGVVWAQYGVLSGLAMSPTGDYLLVAASFDDQVKVVDTASNSVVASVPVGDFPLQLAFNDDGTRALVTNYFGNSYTLLDIDGAGSSVVTTRATGEKPMRLAYNPVDDTFGVGVLVTKQVLSVDPQTGNTIGVENFPGYGSLVQVLYDEVGSSVVLTASNSSEPGHLHREAFGAVHTLPANPAFFDYNAQSRRAVVAMPGPDFVTILEYESASGAPEATTLPLSRPGVMFAPAPNPAVDESTIRFALAGESNTEMYLMDSSGRRLRTLLEGTLGAGSHQVEWRPGGVASGVYFAVLRVNGEKIGRQKLVVE